jgi:hypothetical protein
MGSNEILKCIDKHLELEKLYRSDPKQFYAWLCDALANNPESETLKAWDARLNYSEPLSNPENKTKILHVILISFLAVILVKLPFYFPISKDWFYPRFVPIVVFSSLITYFLSTTNASIRQKYFSITGVIIAVFTMLLMPDKQNSASILMSQIHMPLILFSLLGLTYMAEKWKSAETKLRYIRYIGEVVIYSTIILLGGVVLTGLTFSLFGLIGVAIEKWYMEYVVVWGLVASPIFATYLFDAILDRESKLATLIANIFAPLCLITFVVYLLAMLYALKNPYSDRDFLITFNGILVLVWGITVFSISGRSISLISKVTDTINIALISVVLVINTIALSAILFRLAEYGITPNRVAVTGANVLIFVHLIVILRAYVNQLQTKDNLEYLMPAIADYLPYYSMWSVFIVVFLPILFKFK